MASIYHRTTSTGAHRWDIHYRENGKQFKQTFDIEGDAKKFRTDVEEYGAAVAERKAITRTVSRTESGTLSGMLTDYLQKSGIESATIESYEGFIARDIAPVFGDRHPALIDKTDIIDWTNAMEKGGELEGHTFAPVLKKTIINKIGFLSGAYNWAVEKNIVQSYPCLGVKIKSDTAQERCYLKPADFEQVTKSCKD